MSTESFHNSPCQCCNCWDEGREWFWKPAISFPSWLLGNLNHSTAWIETWKMSPRTWMYPCPWWKSHPQQFQKQCKKILGSCDYQLNKSWPKFEFNPFSLKLPAVVQVHTFLSYKLFQLPWISIYPHKNKNQKGRNKHLSALGNPETNSSFVPPTSYNGVPALLPQPHCIRYKTQVLKSQGMNN